MCIKKRQYNDVLLKESVALKNQFKRLSCVIRSGVQLLLLSILGRNFETFYLNQLGTRSVNEPSCYPQQGPIIARMYNVLPKL